MAYVPGSDQVETYDGPLMAHPYVGKTIGYAAIGSGGLDVLYASSRVAADLSAASEPETLVIGGAGAVLMLAGDWVRRQYCD